MTRPDADPLETAAETPQVERRISPIAGRLGFGCAGKAATVLALAAGSGLFLLATARHPTVQAAETLLAPAKQVVAFEPAQAPASAPTLAHPGPDAPSLGPTPAAGTSSAGPMPAPTAASPASSAAPPSAPILAYSRSLSATAGPAPDAAPIRAIAAAASEPSQLDRLRQSAPVGVSRATRLPDRSFLILAGTSIPCLLQTAMDSATPGYVSCVTPTNTYSDSGGVVLLEKGTRVLGAYRGGLKQGQGRLFVVWTRAVTPAGVAITLASPAADALGRAGFDGTVDTHFWQRFGGSILMSVIDGGLGAIGRSTGGVTFQAPSTAANTALQGSIDIAPTLRKAPGAEVSILVAQDLDFSGVYGVRAR